MLFPVWHETWGADEALHRRLVGVFTSAERWAQAVGAARTLPGFRDARESFGVAREDVGLLGTRELFRVLLRTGRWHLPREALGDRVWIAGDQPLSDGVLFRGRRAFLGVAASEHAAAHLIAVRGPDLARLGAGALRASPVPLDTILWPDGYDVPDRAVRPLDRTDLAG